MNFRGKEYILQNSIVDFECKSVARHGGLREYTDNESTKTELARNLLAINHPEWHGPDHPNAIVNAIETETLKEDSRPEMKSVMIMRNNMAE